jgi:hypothetical protein
MAHAPEQLEYYVCMNCQVTYAGSVTTDDGGHNFSPPDDCAVCGDPDFVETETYIHRAASE